MLIVGESTRDFGRIPPLYGSYIWLNVCITVHGICSIPSAQIPASDTYMLPDPPSSLVYAHCFILTFLVFLKPTMKLSTSAARAATVASLLAISHAVPVSHERNIIHRQTPDSGIDNANIPGNPIAPVGSSGNIYGAGLLGPSGDSLPPQELGPSVPELPASPSEAVGSYTLVQNQQADPTLGLYLDFSNTEKPQAIRAGNGWIDSGPSEHRCCAIAAVANQK